MGPTNKTMTDISQHYGGSILALTGKDSVLIVYDRRLGNGAITTNMNFDRLHLINKSTVVGLSMFVPDGQMDIKNLIHDVNLYEINNNITMSTKSIAKVSSSYLYNKRMSPHYVEPIIAGIDDKKPYIFSMDCLGSTVESKFLAAGTAEKNLFGLAESLYYDNMTDEELFTTGIQIFLNAIDRDGLSGWGCASYLVSNDGVVRREVKCRRD